MFAKVDSLGSRFEKRERERKREIVKKKKNERKISAIILYFGVTRMRARVVVGGLRVCERNLYIVL